MTGKSPLCRKVVILFAILMVVMLAPVAAWAEPEPGRYVINLTSELTSFEASQLASVEVPEGWILYTTEYEKDGVVWYRLRIGFFPGSGGAKQGLAKFMKQFPEAWVTQVPIEERDQVLAEQASVATGGAVSVFAPVGREALAEPERPTLSGLKGVDEPQLLAEADRAIAGKNFVRAIQLYTKLSRGEDAAVREQAQQKLGLAREYNGQLAHAKAEYRRYLKLYPEGAAAKEIRKRLDNLQQGGRPANVAGNGGPAGIAAADASFWRKNFHGSLSEFYYRNETNTDAADNLVTQSALHSDLNFNLRLRSEDVDIQTVFVGGQESNFLESDRSRSRVSSAYVNLVYKPADYSLRLGRQSSSSGGVLGRFDGGLLGLRLSDKIKMNLVGGFPVQSSTSGLETDKHFYGINFDLGTFGDRWDFNTFYIDQETAGIVDRRAVGGEIRYFHPRGSFFSLIDYDIYYRELNTLLAVGSLTLPTETVLNFSVDFRQSPSMTTSNALIGQSDSSLDDLLDRLGESAVQDLARDRTALSRMVTVGFTQPINEKLQIAGDVTWSNLDGTKASGGVDEIEGSGDEFYYSLQLIGSSFIREGDLAILGLRYGDTANADLYSVNVNTRYPVTRDWRLNPRLSLDFRKNRNDGSDQFKVRPSIRTDYRLNRFLDFELEGGLEWSNRTIAGQKDDDRRGYFIIAGFRVNF